MSGSSPEGMPVRLEDLDRGQVLRGVQPGPVTLVDVDRHGPDAVTVTFKDTAGGLGQQLLYRTDEERLRIETPQARWSFDADPAEFRLAAEALRIRMAGLHDPMVAVSSSAVDPLPHQIRAVYGELLPRTPLRFVLADDPGAGKTIMAGLYAKELMLRGDLTRMLIVAPGSLVEQWQDELATKFGIDAQLLSREMIASSPDANPFERYPLLIARMDQLARNDDLLALLDTSEWDLVVVDEAHRMSATWYGGELDVTRRYQLGQRLGQVTRHLLLMTATPHNGNETSFQAFMALLDPDRFEGEYRSGAHTTDTSGLMRRMVKEELLTFDGTPLFPERIAETVPYTLSDGERQLYDEVTRYVREEMNRADRLGADNPRARTVGFALTVLQRRLASSPHAIVRSLQRRRERLGTKRRDLLTPTPTSRVDDLALTGIDFDDPDEYDAGEREEMEEQVVDAATAAQTVAELDIEITRLGVLVALAEQVRDSGEDRKWAELRSLLLDRNLLRDAQGAPRKLIVFTEHRDTLDYLTAQIRNILGREDAVVTIHGGTRREDRRTIREQFTHNPDTQVLIATDAAGEGLNLQAAHLMINYDLPWNPNRLEQRFGRIHRIGQRHTCRLWNLVADGTREGHVFTRLLEKMETQRRAYGGRLFDVLGDAFTDRPLRTLLLDAIRYGDDPARLAALDQVVDAEVSRGLDTLLEERALAHEALAPHELDRLRREMDEARARRLQPHYIAAFFHDAFPRLGGRLPRREAGRFEITHVPATVRTRQRPGSAVPIVSRYQRVTFDPDHIDLGEPTAPRAELLAPGHPLLDTVLDATIETHQQALETGTVLFDPHDPAEHPRLIVAVTGEISDGTGVVVSKRFDFITLTPDGTATLCGPAPYLDLQPLPAEARTIADKVLGHSWLAGGVEQLAATWAITHAQPEHLAQVKDRVLPLLDKTRAAVHKRLTQQINYLDSEAARLRDILSTRTQGRHAKPRHSPDRLEARARDLETRLTARTTELDLQSRLAAKPPQIAGAVLVIPAGMLPGAPARYAKETARIERRAVDKVLAAEHALGRIPEEMPHNNKGYDIRSLDPQDGHYVFIEVKGRIEGAEDFTVTFNEVLYGKNVPDRHRLAMVSVSDRGPDHDQLRYVHEPFRRIDLGDLAATEVRLHWAKTWAKGGPPS